MTISTGTKLSHYEITSQIGKGGMGEVYQATDTKLGRSVAIKVLPEEFAKDADRVARFQREAKLLASLNHPNIAAIHGLEEVDGTHFLVMELVEGNTLDDLVKAGAIPVEEALKLALQIAEALEAAHEKGVIHRDLKPANIKVTPDDKVKVLDFGLAKAFAGEQADLNLSNSPTLSVAATQQGVILGTAAYMSPEHARGKEVDKRADIWAFGVVLFEMLTGKQLFTGDTVSDTLASVLAREPDWQSLPPNLHPRIRLLLERCIEKEPKNRYHDIADVRVDIQKVLADPSGVLVQPVPSEESRTKFRTMISWLVATLILGAVIAGTAVWQLIPIPKPRVIRWEYVLPEDQVFDIDLSAPILAISPDGTQFVYNTNEGLYLRTMNQLKPRLIVGSDESPRNPLFSPDGNWIGYIADNRLKKISVDEGMTETLCAVNNPTGVNWCLDNTIIYAEIPKGVMRISENGGTPEPIDLVGSGNIIYPQILPNGESILFTLLQTEPLKIAVQRFGSEERKELFPGYCAKYIPTGHIVYWRDNNLYAVPFDPDKLEVTGERRPLVDGVLKPTSIAHPAQYAVSDTGTLIYMPGIAGSDKRNLVWVDRNGHEEPLTAQPDAYSNPSISPDGKRVALRIDRENNADIFILDLNSETPMRLTFDPAVDTHPLWSPDGQKVLFTSNREGDGNRIYWKAADGNGTDTKLFPEPRKINFWPSSWSNDGNTLIISVKNNTTFDLGAFSMEGEKTWKYLLTDETKNLGLPKISSDGKWIAYQSGELFVRPFPDVEGGGQRQISFNSGGQPQPLWSPTGPELFYRGANEVMAVSINVESTFDFETPRPLFPDVYVNDQTVNWDIHPTNGKFLMMKPAESAVPAHRKIIIVTNWFEELKKLAPVQ